MSSTIHGSVGHSSLGFICDKPVYVSTQGSSEAIPSSVPADILGENRLNHHGIDALTISFFLLATVGLSLLACLEMRKRPSLPMRVPEGKASPCRSCRFFGDSRYVKCAVHPSRALTSEAEECSDREPRNNG